MIDLMQLQQLVTVSECGNISRAAEMLHMSQSSISRSMQKLEDILEVQLFERNGKRLRLSPVGIKAVERAKPLLQLANDYAKDIQAYNRQLSTVSIGSVAPLPLRSLLNEIGDISNGIHFSAEVNETKDLIDGLISEKYRLILTTDPVEYSGIFCTNYVESRIYLLIPNTHPLRNRTHLSLNDLRGLTILTYNYDDYMPPFLKDMDIRVIMQSDFKVLADLVDATDLPYMVSSLYLYPLSMYKNRIPIQIEDEMVYRNIYLSCRRKDREVLKLINKELTTSH